MVIDFTAFIGRLATSSGETILPFFRGRPRSPDQIVAAPFVSMESEVQRTAGWFPGGSRKAADEGCEINDHHGGSLRCERENVSALPSPILQAAHGLRGVPPAFSTFRRRESAFESQDRRCDFLISRRSRMRELNDDFRDRLTWPQPSIL